MLNNKFKEWSDATNFLITLEKEAGVGNYKSTIIGGTIGAALGGLRGYTAKDTDDKKERAYNTAIGTLGGGLFGGAIGYSRDTKKLRETLKTPQVTGSSVVHPESPKVQDIPKSPQLEKIQPKVQDSSNILYNDNKSLTDFERQLYNSGAYKTWSNNPLIKKDPIKSASYDELKEIEDRIMHRASSVRKIIKEANFLQTAGDKIKTVGSNMYNATKGHVSDAAKMTGYGAASGAGLGIIRATGDNSHPGETTGQTLKRYGNQAAQHAIGGGAIGLGLKGLSMSGKLNVGSKIAALNIESLRNFATPKLQAISNFAKANPNLTTTLGSGVIGAGIGGVSDGSLSGAAMGGAMGAGLGAAGSYGRKGFNALMARNKGITPELEHAMINQSPNAQQIAAKTNISKGAIPPMHQAPNNPSIQSNPEWAATQQLNAPKLEGGYSIGTGDVKAANPMIGKTPVKSNYDATQITPNQFNNSLGEYMNNAQAANHSFAQGRGGASQMYSSPVLGVNSPTKATILQGRTINAKPKISMPGYEPSQAYRDVSQVKMALAMPNMNTMMKTPMTNNSLLSTGVKMPSTSLANKMKTPGTGMLKNQLPNQSTINSGIPQV
jgi:hypothetical protein